MMNFANFIGRVSHLTTVTAKQAPKANRNARAEFKAKALSECQWAYDGFPKVENVKKQPTHWVKAAEDGSFLVSLKNGIALLPLDGKSNEARLKSVAEVIEYITIAIECSEAGEFDEAFAATKPTGKKKAVVASPKPTPTSHVAAEVETLLARAALKTHPIAVAA